MSPHPSPPSRASRTTTREAVPRHARRPRRAARVAGLAGLGALLFAGTGASLTYADIQGNISREDIGDLLGRDDDERTAVEPRPGEPLNFLVLGSDERAGDSDVDGAGASGEVTGMRADTTMLVHVSAGRDRVEVISIPRDTLVDIPSCRLPDGSTTEAHEGMFNSAFTIGGDTGSVGAAAACTIRTVEDLTGVTIDDFVVVDFAGFMNVIDAVDGIAVQVPESVDDQLYTGLTLDAGCHVMDGETALKYARVRHGVGDGGDISRITRQQAVVDAVATEVLGRDLVTDMPALYAFLDAATSTLTTGPELGSLPTLAGLATSVRDMDAEDIDFITMPFVPAGPRVVPTTEAEELFARLAADRPAVPEPTAAPEADPSDSPAGTADEDPPDPEADAASTPPASGSGSDADAAPVCTK